MKKLIIILMAVSGMLLLPALALADSGQGGSKNGQGGYTGPSAGTVTVADLKKMNDDVPVILVGKIDKSFGMEKYEFSDGTGAIIVNIDDDLWGAMSIGPNDIIEIHGELDKDINSLEIDVDSILKR